MKKHIKNFILIISFVLILSCNNQSNNNTQENNTSNTNIQNNEVYVGPAKILMKAEYHQKVLLHFQKMECLNLMSLQDMRWEATIY